ncbi:type II toxin-antitoxin system HicB family antitoxin [Peptostreptococcus sp.]|uniref:type II toxin-antitoxin system HicB family antitoxin n=1 Tax=Peptostreptococcus sp. TaxID=1262 RepID=UPI001D905404|nr:type II toxin-antitoxin system HicB family antitoxin [Peptostreptococcus sp.]MBS5596621.1 type II toxin-antitoxin system HicB family antitoxin [Peptostreptococcus sp.]
MEKILKYPIVAREDGDFWIIFIPDFYKRFGGMTQVEDAREIRKMAADYIKLAVEELIESGEEIPKPSTFENLDMSEYEEFKFDNSVDYRMYVGIDLPEVQYAGSL